MAEIRLNDEQQGRLNDLLAQIVHDAALRARLESDPRAVFAQFGLDSLLHEGEDIEELRASVEAPEVAGFLMHADRHVDDHTDSHTDWHSDVHEDSGIFRGMGLGLPSINIGPIG